MASWPFKRKRRNNGRKPAERISDLRIVYRDFYLINGEAVFQERGGRG